MEIITIIAILVSPAIAVGVSMARQNWYQNQQEELRRKKFIFAGLMSTRHQVVSDEIVRLLHLIDVEFHDKDEVRKLWKELHSMLYNRGLDNPEGYDQLDKKRLELITEMAKVVGYGEEISPIDVDRVYKPIGLTEDTWRMRSIGIELLRVLQKSGGFQMLPKEQPKKKDEKKNVLNEILK